MQLFVLRNETTGQSMDLTNNIELGSYKVSKAKGYESWTDSNYTVHREIIYKKAAGTLTLKFFDLNTFQSFLNFYESATATDGSTPVTLYLNNLMLTANTKAFIDFETANIQPYLAGNLNSDDTSIDITIQER